MSYDKYVFNDIGLISTATNIKKSENPPFKIEDFFAIYPQFQGLEELPDRIVKMYIDFANEVVNVERWGKQWVLGMCLFVALIWTQMLKLLL